MMKLRTTTSASLTRFTKMGITFVVALFLVGAGIFYVINKPASADEYDRKIAALQEDMARYQAEVDRLNSEAVTLQNTLASLANEKRALQAQIDVNQAQHDKLVIEIAETEQKIKDNQDVLGDTLADLYVDDSITPIEMIASSTDIGEFLDKQEYRNSVKDELGTTIKKVKTLKEELSTKKEEVTKVLESQKAARTELVAKESEQASLLASTQNDEAQFQNMISASQSEIDEARRIQAELRARTQNTGGYNLVASGSLGAYPWNASNCPMMSWLSTGGANGNGGDGRGYGCRQCASYVAWRIAKETGRYYSWGNGGMFASAAIRAGYTNLGSSPQPGSIAVILGNPGHVAWVEAVSGNQVLVSQYNYNYGAGWGLYSEMWLSTSFFDQYVKIT